MSIEETFDDCPLLDAAAILSSRHESGRLQITAGSTRGAFFFRKGKVVDARMGPFTGFSAVNLAVSIGGPARLSFNPTIQPPTSCFKVLNERIIMRQRFGIETEGPELAGDRRIVTASAERACSPSQQVAPAEVTFPGTRVAAPPRRTKGKAINIGDRFTTKVLSLTGAFRLMPRLVAPLITKLEVSRRKSAFLSSSLRLLTSSLTNSSRRTLTVGVGLILSIVIPATVATYRSRGKAVAPPTVALPETPGILPAPIVVPPTAHKDEQALTQKPITQLMPRDPKPSTVKPAASLEVKAARLLSDSRPRDNAEVVSGATADRQAPKGELSARPSSRTVVVMVQIDQGHVTEAYIPHHQPGLRAYEATALRLARQRRYGKDTKRKETITLQVTREP